MSNLETYYGLRLSQKEMEQLLWALDGCKAYFPVREKLESKLREVDRQKIAK